MKIKLNILSIFLFCISLSFAQDIPKSVKYSVVYYGENKEVLVYQKVGVKITLIKDTSDFKTATYIETHLASTNGYGLVELMLGRGTVIKGDFNTINWKDKYFIVTESDLTGGENYTMKTVQLITSLPIAINASNAPKGDDGPIGDQGATGKDAIDGDQGDQGVEGNQGPTGDKGLTGAKGRDGKAQNQFLSLSKTGDTLILSDGNRVVLPGISIYNQGKKFVPGTLSDVICPIERNKGKYFLNQDANETFLLGYLGANGGNFDGLTIPSTGVNGLNANIESGVFNKGFGQLAIKITGKAQSIGEAKFTVNIGGKSCTFIQDVIALNSEDYLSLDCYSYVFKGDSLKAMKATNNSSFTLHYSSSIEKGFQKNQSIQSFGVLGLTATLRDTITAKEGDLQFKITGTPDKSGTALFKVILGNIECDIKIPVLLPDLIVRVLDCDSVKNNGVIRVNTSLSSSVFSEVKFDGSNGGIMKPVEIKSSGAEGLTATIFCDTLFNEFGTIKINISGKATKSGIAIFSIPIGGKTCNLKRKVEDTAVVVFACDKIKHYGKLIAEDSIIGAYVKIPYSGAKGAYLGQELKSNEDNNVFLRLNEGIFTNSSDSLILQFIGKPTKVGKATFDLKIGGKTCPITKLISLPYAKVDSILSENILKNWKLGDTLKDLSVKLNYKGGNGGRYFYQRIASDGVEGLVAVLDEGELLKGDGSINLKISGVSNTTGSAVFDFSFANWYISLSLNFEADLIKISNTIIGEVEGLTDIDGNRYKTVKIGSQIWMAENLKVSKYNDGISIPNITDDIQWSYLTTGAWTYYNNDAANNDKYGKLYNWYAVSPTTNGNKNMCPIGWHVPTDAEWTLLTDYLGGESVAGGKMKEVGTTSWNSPNTDAKNTSLFTGLPGGTRDYNYNGVYYDVGHDGYWWSSSENLTDNAWFRLLHYYSGGAYRYSNYKGSGFSVRCLRD